VPQADSPLNRVVSHIAPHDLLTAWRQWGRRDNVSDNIRDISLSAAPPTIADLQAEGVAGACVTCRTPDCPRSIRRSYVICLQSLNAIRRCQTSNCRGFNVGEFREMVKVSQDAEFAGLVSGEIGSSEVLSPKHRSLLSSYRLNLRRGQKVVHDMIVPDINASLDLGASKHATDCLSYYVRSFYVGSFRNSRRLFARRTVNKAQPFTALVSFAKTTPFDYRQRTLVGTSGRDDPHATRILWIRHLADHARVRRHGRHYGHACWRDNFRRSDRDCCGDYWCDRGWRPRAIHRVEGLTFRLAVQAGAAFFDASAPGAQAPHDTVMRRPYRRSPW
jgi:hypothetical protein